MRGSSSTLVLLDTSFLLLMLREHREFEIEIRAVLAGPVNLATVDRVWHELERLARAAPRGTAGLAKVALDQLAARRVEIIETIFGLPDVDTALVATSLSEKAPVKVATADRSLRETLKRLGIPTMFPRKHRGLVSR